MTAGRIIRLLEPRPELTPQQRYRRSPKGRAAQARYHAGRVARDPGFRAAAIARATTSERSNATARRVYKRVWIARKRREMRAA